MTEQGGKLVTAQMDLPPDIDGILDIIRGILQQGGVQTIKLALGEPVVYTRITTGDENDPFEGARSYVDLPIADIVRQRPMEDSPLNESSILGPAHFIQAMLLMHLKDYTVTHLVLGPKTVFWKWLGIDPLLASRVTHVCGAKVEIDKTLGVDRAILCGARTRDASRNEIEFSLVLFMEVTT